MKLIKTKTEAVKTKLAFLLLINLLIKQLPYYVILNNNDPYFRRSFIENAYYNWKIHFWDRLVIIFKWTWNIIWSISFQFIYSE